MKHNSFALLIALLRLNTSVYGGQSVPMASATEGLGAETASFFITPKGDDRWSGALADPGGNDGPFATLERARDAIRAKGP